MTETIDTDVVIVGAGIAGLAVGMASAEILTSDDGPRTSSATTPLASTGGGLADRRRVAGALAVAAVVGGRLGRTGTLEVGLRSRVGFVEFGLGVAQTLHAGARFGFLGAQLFVFRIAGGDALGGLEPGALQVGALHPLRLFPAGNPMRHI